MIYFQIEHGLYFVRNLWRLFYAITSMTFQTIKYNDYVKYVQESQIEVIYKKRLLSWVLELDTKVPTSL